MNEILIYNEEVKYESILNEEKKKNSELTEIKSEELNILRNMKLYLLLNSVQTKKKRESWQKW